MLLTIFDFNTNKKHEINCESTSNVAFLKEQLSLRTGLSIKEQELLLFGIPMKNDFILNTWSFCIEPSALEFTLLHIPKTWDESEIDETNLAVTVPQPNNETKEENQPKSLEERFEEGMISISRFQKKHRFFALEKSPKIICIRKSCFIRYFLNSHISIKASVKKYGIN